MSSSGRVFASALAACMVKHSCSVLCAWSSVRHLYSDRLSRRRCSKWSSTQNRSYLDSSCSHLRWLVHRPDLLMSASFDIRKV